MGEEQGPYVYRLPFGLYAKFGPRVNVGEANAMLFVEANTTIPVPSVLDVIESTGRIMILMTQLPGEPLVGGLKALSPDDTTHMVETLRGWFTQLRSLPGGTESVCAFGGGECRSYRVDHDDTFGPFRSINDFHAYLLEILPDEFRDEMRVTARASHSKSHEIAFAHGDIHPSNLLVSQNRLTGLIDWECAGWYPEYWDYTGAVHRRQRYTEWYDLFRRVFPQYQVELDVEMAFWAVHFPF
ncbi:kinase-like domain-containing protein [Hygrophoropsis aurantiaca]|uniref:Kinase-like domain-containing protein n=1 Tax=Hygrophoropsis aurantiaca TaxID=72124 RepID=A0ACB8AAJ9_9AGAM|nr:kinase-like domain-containing protein [Hygrophoropsis aurantiaca]